MLGVGVKKSWLGAGCQESFFTIQASLHGSRISSKVENTLDVCATDRDAVAANAAVRVAVSATNSGCVGALDVRSSFVFTIQACLHGSGISSKSVNHFDVCGTERDALASTAAVISQNVSND